jgi:hypothetical protein
VNVATPRRQKSGAENEEWRCPQSRVPRHARLDKTYCERLSRSSATKVDWRSITSAAAAATAITTATTAAAVTAAAAATAATTTAAATAVTTTATTTSIFTGLGLIHGEAPAIVFLIVQSVDGCLCLSLGVHFDKAETLAPARGAVLNYLRALNGAELREQLLQNGVTDPVGQIPNVQLLAHR